MKIYTRTGDDGTTGLIGGSRVKKSDRRIDVYGTIDELSATIGLAAVQAEGEALAQLRHVQDDLFILGSHLATPDTEPASKTQWLPPLQEQMISRLEMQIDSMTAELPALRNFILPGGTELAARLHLARTVCRRAERTASEFAEDRPVPTLVLTYLNRLSDWLFTAARHANFQKRVEDIPWVAKAE